MQEAYQINHFSLLENEFLLFCRQIRSTSGIAKLTPVILLGINLLSEEGRERDAFKWR